VWLNTPLRPQDASATSGMKSTMNGALNCTEIDGWWPECFDPDLGWAISSAETVEDEDHRNELEANSLFELLEQQIIPLYYDRPDGLPRGWIGTMKRSVAQLGPFLSSSRMVRDYATALYAPAAVSASRLARDGHAGSRELATWRRRVIDAWHEVHIDDVRADESVGDLTSTRSVTATVALGQLGAPEVHVQLLSGLVGQAGELESATGLDMTPDGDAVDGHITYRAELPLEVAGRRGITVRVVPRHELLANPLELGCVAWAG